MGSHNITIFVHWNKAIEEQLDPEVEPAERLQGAEVEPNQG